jgi:hypothetical protein
MSRAGPRPAFSRTRREVGILFNGFRNRYLLAAYPLMLLVLAMGCTTKEDPAEVLVMCGNHTCGDLVMVTVDTSSDGFQYLDPAISPDGARVAFTADWSTIYSDPDYEGEPILSRQILQMPIPAYIWDDSYKRREPVEDIQALGAELVRFQPFVSRVGGVEITVDGLNIDKGCPVWVGNDTLIVLGRFSTRDRFLIANVSNPAGSTPDVLFYEPDDLRAPGEGDSERWIWYHNDPALSPDGRWLVYTRFGCSDLPNVDDVRCSRESLWVLDMTTVSDPTDTNAVVTFPLTSGSISVEDPAWNPAGDQIVFASTTDLEGNNSGFVGEIYRVDFDAVAAAANGEVPVDDGLRRLTTTEAAENDPIVGLANYAPCYSSNGARVYFVSTRRAPGSTLRGRSIWSAPSDGRLDPELLFHSRQDDVDPTVYWPTGDMLLSSRMGFPSEQLDALEQAVIDSLHIENIEDEWGWTDTYILRQAADVREELEFFEDVMMHLYMFRGF